MLKKLIVAMVLIALPAYAQQPYQPGQDTAGLAVCEQLLFTSNKTVIALGAENARVSAELKKAIEELAALKAKEPASKPKS